MTQTSLVSTQGRLDRLTRKWWIILLLVLVNLIPPITAKPPQDWSEMNVVWKVLFRNSLLHSLSSPWWAAFDILPIALVLGIVFLGNRVSRLFSAYVAVAYLLFAVLQSVSITQRYGFGLVTCNFIWFVMVSGLWAWEAVRGLNDLTRSRTQLWRYWVVPLALFAFWIPLAPDKTGAFHFVPLYFMKMHSGLAFCLMTPVFLSVLTLYWPRVNVAVMRVTALAGTIVGFWNMMTAFVFERTIHSMFGGVIHFPLVLISIYALVLSYVKPHARQERTHDQGEKGAETRSPQGT